MARRGNLLPVFASILQEIATPVCALVRNDAVVGTQVRRFELLDKLQFEQHFPRKQRRKYSQKVYIFLYNCAIMA